MKTFTVKLADPNINELPNKAFAQTYRNWCTEMFGAPFQGMPRKERKWTDMRWCQYYDYFKFKHEEDAMLFILKWSGPNGK